MPIRELERLQAVNRFLKLEISKEKELQSIVELAARVCNTPIALITFIDDQTQHIRFKFGTDLETTAKEHAFCDHVIKQQMVMSVPDALKDRRFSANPLVLADPHIRFYAGAPLTTQDGYNLGSLCVIDQIPGELTTLQQEMLQALSRQVIQLLEFESSLQILKQQFIEAKRSEIELRSFFESSMDVHLLLGKEFEVLAFNKTLERLVAREYNVQVVKGNLMDKYLNPALRDGFYRNYLKALRGTAAYEQRKVDYRDTEVWWIIKYEPAFDQSGEIIGVSVNSTDVTKSVEQRALMQVQSDSLEEIAFIQSHELRRPVASIIGLLEILKEEGHCADIEEFKLLDKVVNELDEKIRMVVGYTEEGIKTK